jgi:hypothetical protein
MATTQITAEPGVPQMVVASEFAAPRDLLYTDPDLLAQWLGPRGLTVIIDHVDARDRGTWRYIGSDADGGKYSFHGATSSAGIVLAEDIHESIERLDARLARLVPMS